MLTVFQYLASHTVEWYMGEGNGYLKKKLKNYPTYKNYYLKVPYRIVSRI
jgi:hypothetical protein